MEDAEEEGGSEEGEANDLADGEGTDLEAWIGACEFDGKADEGIEDDVAIGEGAFWVRPMESKEQEEKNGEGEGGFDELRGEYGEGVQGGCWNEMGVDVVCPWNGVLRK